MIYDVYESILKRILQKSTSQGDYKKYTHIEKFTHRKFSLQSTFLHLFWCFVLIPAIVINSQNYEVSKKYLVIQKYLVARVSDSIYTS